MRRLDDIFTLGLDDSAEGVRNFLAVMSWGFPIRTPGEVHLTRTGTKIHKRDSALETYGSSDTRDFRRDLFVTGFRFQDDDNNTANWRPQGLSGSADAAASGSVDGRKFLLVGWYYIRKDGSEAGDVWPSVDGGITWVHPMRVSLVDVTSMDDISYRHILLVQPTGDGSSFEPAEGHCGGIVWYGRWLFVQGNTGLNVFDMDAIQDLSASNPDYAGSTQVGISGGVGHAAGYRYVVPRVMTYTVFLRHPRRRPLRNSGPGPNLRPAATRCRGVGGGTGVQRSEGAQLSRRCRSARGRLLGPRRLRAPLSP